MFRSSCNEEGNKKKTLPSINTKIGEATVISVLPSSLFNPKSRRLRDGKEQRSQTPAVFERSHTTTSHTK